MKLILIKKDRLIKKSLPNKITGKQSLYHINALEKKELLLNIEASDGKWIIKAGKNASFINDSYKEYKEHKITSSETIELFIKRTGEKATLLIEDTDKPDELYQKYTHIDNTKISIGSNSDNDIVINKNGISEYHAYILISNEAITVNNLDQHYGSYLNSNSITSAIAKAGDVLCIQGVDFIFGKGFIAFNYNTVVKSVNNQKLLPYIPQKIDSSEKEEYFDDVRCDNYFYCSPRFKRDIEKAIINFDAPPSQNKGSEMPLILTLGPSFTMGLASIATASFSIVNAIGKDGSISSAIPSAIMAGSMLLGTLIWPVISKRFEKVKLFKDEKKRLKKYRIYLDQIKAKISKEITNQEEILRNNHIPLQQCLERITLQQRNLWERLPIHNDFLEIRLGTGSLPFNADIKYPEEHFTLNDDILNNEMLHIASEKKKLNDVPITINLTKDFITGITGDRNLVAKFTRNIIFELAALHSYAYLKIIIIYDKSENNLWEYFKWFPHVWDNNHNIRFIASSADSLKYLSSYIEKEIDYCINSNVNSQEMDCHYVIIATDNNLCKKVGMISKILSMNEYHGFSLLTLYNELKNLPKECHKIVNISNENSKIFDKDDISGNFLSFKADLFNDFDPMKYAVSLSNIKLDLTENISQLPEMLTFLEMNKVQKIGHLNCLEKWKENNPVFSLKAPIGVDESGMLIQLDLHEKAHGPHGLIAGMTGSGKSEFIMTYILSLAVNYHPYEVAFILIDYKGGGMANAFTELPHLAGTITNLDGAAVNRSLVSIQSELKKRQAIFGDTGKKLGISNIDIYKYQKLYREGSVKEPLQHLFIISDEFAELKTQQPEFMQQLVSAARIGRSLGVHLILATQKPSGVVDDQIWSNSRFRICLKVQETSDSNDVIKKPDAAAISTTGRFYMQVGYDEVFELGQSAWSGAAYYPDINKSLLKDESIIYIDETGRNILQASNKSKVNLPKNPKKQIDETIKYLKLIADEENIHVKPLWLKPIPEIIFYKDIKEKYEYRSKKYEFNPIIGEYDDPENQNQNILTLPIYKNGNALIYGSSGMGKTTLLSTLIYSLITEHTFEELTIQILDFGSETLRCFEKSPIVENVICSYDGDKINALFSYLKKELETRKKLFADYGGDFYSYINAGKNIKSQFIIIQGFAEFAECFSEYEEDVGSLSREGAKYGIFFILTSLSTNGIRFKLLQNFSQIICLQLNDSDYSGVLGQTKKMVPEKYKGRGLIRTDKLYEFQTAYIYEPENNISKLRAFCTKQNEECKNGSDPCIRTMPDLIDINYLSNYNIPNVESLPIGISKKGLEVKYIELNNYINCISSRNIVSNIQIDGIIESLNKFSNFKSIIINTNDVSVLSQNIQEIFKIVLTRYRSYKTAEKEKQTLPEFEKINIVFANISLCFSGLKDEDKEEFDLLLCKGFIELNISILIIDSLDFYTDHYYKEWFINNNLSKNFIWIGPGISNQIVFNSLLITNSDKIQPSHGYAVKNSAVEEIKIIVKSGGKYE